MTARESRLRRVSDVYRARGESKDRSIGYGVYAGVLVVLVAIAPATRALLLLLLEPQTLAVLGSASSSAAVSLGLAIVIACVPLLGALRGPAFIAEPFVANVLLKTDLSRARVLAKPVLASIGLIASAITGVFVVLSAALAIGDRSDLGRAVVFIGCGACFAVTLTLAWMVGQRLGTDRAWGASAALAMVIAVENSVPGGHHFTPWGWVASTYPSTPGSHSVVPLVMSACAAGASLSGVFLLARSLGERHVVDQSLRWRVAVTAAVAGDPGLALATFRPLPRVGRSWAAVPATLASPIIAMWRSDAIGALRTPLRSLGAVAGLLLAGAVGGFAYAAVPGGRVLAACAGVTAYLALGPLSDGLRHAAEAYAAPCLYGYPPNRLVWLHATMPVTTGAAAVIPASVMVAADTPVMLVMFWMVVTVVLLRVFDSAKGALSPVLLTPIPTPFGDLSGLVVLGWHLDAPMIAGGASLIVAMSDGQPIAVTMLAALGTSAAVCWMTMRRFRRL